LERTVEKPSPAIAQPAGSARTLSRSDSIAALLVVFFGALYAFGSRFALRGFPYSGDEYSYLLQGEIFARGMLRAPAPPNATLLRVDHVVIDDFVRSKYPPGTSALLSLGVRAGVPWLVTPLEGVVTLVVVWLTARALFGPRAALVTLIVLGASPLFAVEAASFYAHTATTMWLAGAFAAVTAWTLTRKAAWLPLAGAMMGCAFLTRPLDAVLFGAALIALRSWKVLVLVAAGAMPFALANLAYQAAVFGSPFTDGYTAYQPTFRAIYGADTATAAISLSRIVSPLHQWFHLEICTAFVSPWTMPGAVLAAVFGAVAIAPGHRARPMRNVALAIPLVTLVALVPMSAEGDDGPRPRYLTTSLLTLAILAGAGWPSAFDALQKALGRRVARALGAIAVVMGFVLVGSLVVDRVFKVMARDGLYEALRASGIDEGVVVVRAQWPTRYARNGPFFDRPLLFLSAPADMSADSIAEKFPSRPIYEATEGSTWTIVRRK
jgi:Dolichyl-phosphate-mannose-protein mannosyltransferase